MNIIGKCQMTDIFQNTSIVANCSILLAKYRRYKCQINYASILQCYNVFSLSTKTGRTAKKVTAMF